MSHSYHTVQEKNVLTWSLFTFTTLVLNGAWVVKDHLFQNHSAHMITMMH